MSKQDPDWEKKMIAIAQANRPNRPAQSDTRILEILGKLWCAVDLEDVDEGLIDVGEIDDAHQAINHEIAEQVAEARIDEVYRLEREVNKSNNGFYMDDDTKEWWAKIGDTYIEKRIAELKEGQNGNHITATDS